MSQQFPPHHHGPYPPYPQYPAPRRRNPLRGLGGVVIAVILAALATVGVILITSHVPARYPHGFSPFAPHGSGLNSLQSLDAQGIAAKVDPGLVDIDTTLGYANGRAAGTGMVLTPDGEVLTNNHVVEGATRIDVTDVGDGKTYQATVVGYDRSEDVAVLKLQGASGLSTVTTGDSAKVAAGDAIVGIGNAGGTGGTPSVAPGQVSALGQSITASDESSGSSEQLTGLIEVNANIQSGDSGGPLVNSSGQVIGMDTAASTGYRFGPRGGRGAGGATGFAIPINQALTVARQIESGAGSSTVHIGDSAFLGVSVADSGGGAAVQDVVSGGPAAGAGLSAGDVITTIGGKTVDSANTLTTLLDRQHPGDNVTLTWLDASGAQQSSTVTLAKGPVG